MHLPKLHLDAEVGQAVSLWRLGTFLNSRECDALKQLVPFLSELLAQPRPLRRPGHCGGLGSACAVAAASTGVKFTEF
jgi:hypothetical protein